MSKQVKKTGQTLYQDLRAEAVSLGINTNQMKIPDLQEAIKMFNVSGQLPKGVKLRHEPKLDPEISEPVKVGAGLTVAEAKGIEERLRYEVDLRANIYYPRGGQPASNQGSRLA